MPTPPTASRRSSSSWASCARPGIEPALLEQPVAREDWEGLGRLAREAGVPVAADESCRTPEDAVRIGRGGLAQVLNIKLAKSGVVQALDIAAIARAFGLGLMIGGMVETRLGMGFSAHLAAGLGGFDWVDLDTPLLLTDDPITGGYRSEGARFASMAVCRATGRRCALGGRREGWGGAYCWCSVSVAMSAPMARRMSGWPTTNVALGRETCSGRRAGRADVGRSRERPVASTGRGAEGTGRASGGPAARLGGPTALRGSAAPGGGVEAAPR